MCRRSFILCETEVLSKKFVGNKIVQKDKKEKSPGDFSFFAMVYYPPKSSKWIISFSTPRLSRRSSTVLAIMGGPQR